MDGWLNISNRYESCSCCVVDDKLTNINKNNDKNVFVRGH